jgi:ribosomal subunit interface protein
MLSKVQVTFRGINHSDAVEAKILEKASRLDRFFQRITTCSVVVESPHNHHKKGKIYRVSVHVSVPGDELVVNREHPVDHSHENLYVAVRDAFDAMLRQLEHYADRRREAR